MVDLLVAKDRPEHRDPPAHHQGITVEDVMHAPAEKLHDQAPFRTEQAPGFLQPRLKGEELRLDPATTRGRGLEPTHRGGRRIRQLRNQPVDLISFTCVRPLRGVVHQLLGKPPPRQCPRDPASGSPSRPAGPGTAGKPWSPTIPLPRLRADRHTSPLPREHSLRTHFVHHIIILHMFLQSMERGPLDKRLFAMLASRCFSEIGFFPLAGSSAVSSEMAHLLFDPGGLSGSTGP